MRGGGEDPAQRARARADLERAVEFGVGALARGFDERGVGPLRVVEQAREGREVVGGHAGAYGESAERGRGFDALSAR